MCESSQYSYITDARCSLSLTCNMPVRVQVSLQTTGKVFVVLVRCPPLPWIDNVYASDYTSDPLSTWDMHCLPGYLLLDGGTVTGVTCQDGLTWTAAESCERTMFFILLLTLLCLQLFLIGTALSQQGNSILHCRRIQYDQVPAFINSGWS